MTTSGLRVRARPVSRAAVIRELDRRLIEDGGIPSAILMEHAGHLAADAIVQRFGRVPTVVWCGPGNNGGDGYVIARHLHIMGAQVAALPVLPPASADCRLTFEIANALGLIRDDVVPELIVDAVFGTGQRAPLVVDAPPWADRGIPVVAIDVPTGIDADTGVRVGAFPNADFVVVIGRLKPYLYASPVEHVLANIGLELLGEGAEAECIDSITLPAWPITANKWDRGHVGVLAGSAEKAGAAILCCRGAMRAGAGLVTLFLPRAAWGRVEALPPEVMLAEPGEYSGVDVLVAGPGLGRSLDAELRALWAEFPRPAVFDADAIRALGALPAASAFPRILTPHAGEAAALLGADWRTLEADRFATAARLGAFATVIYKGACPIVSGAPLRVIPGGSPALGTGGSGDVLAGVCGALFHRLRSGRDVATAAAVLHQRAGASVPVGATASDIADAIPGVSAGVTA